MVLLLVFLYDLLPELCLIHFQQFSVFISRYLTVESAGIPIFTVLAGCFAAEPPGKDPGVAFQDPAIEAIVRKELNYSENTVIYSNDLWGFTEFTVPEEATVYSDLAGMINLNSLSIPNAKSDDFAFLVNLQSLESLEISNIGLDATVLNTIGEVSTLQNLTLTDCTISGIVPLANLRDLKTLNLSNNAIRDLSPLVNLQQLEELHLQYNAVREIGVVASMKNLKVLDLSYNDLSAIPTIGNCVSLEKLNLTHNKLSDISAVRALTNLTHFAAAENKLTDVSVLAACTKLSELDISNNTVADISMFGKLVELTHFNFSNNSVKELPVWPVDCALVSIDGSYNLLSSIDSLADLYHLNRVNMDYNADISSVLALENCPALVRVDVYGTKVSKLSDVTPLTEGHEIIVNFTPDTTATEEDEEE
jgi:Leucine-rich repeat (LRR) protein